MNANAAQNFAILMSSRTVDKYIVNNVVVRYEMISLMQKNFGNYDEYTKNDKNMVYNSITLMGEYYNRYNRIISNTGENISDLGDALLEMLTKEIDQNLTNESKSIDIILAKLILSQVIYYFYIHT